MNKVIKKSLTAAFLSVFVLSLGLSSALVIPSIPTIPLAHAQSVCTVGAIGTSIDNTTGVILTSVHDTVTYTLSGTISNIEDPTAITVNDALSPDLTFVSSTAGTNYSSSTGVWNLGTVSSSTSMSVRLQISATVNAGSEGEKIDNDPTVNYSQSVGTDCAQSAATTDWLMTVEGTPVPPSADLSVTKNVDVTTTTPGSTVHYTVVVKDNGPATSTDAIATDVLPSGLTFVSSTPSNSYNATSGVWTIGDLAPSSTATLVYAAKVDPSIIATTTIVNSVSVSESASTTDPVSDNNYASVGFAVVPNATTTPTSTPFAPLSITKSVNPTSAIEGSTTTVDYAITVTNNSTSTTSTDVVVNDLLPSGLTFVSSTPSSSYNATSGVWTVGNLAAGASSTLAIAAEVDSDATTTITNLATVFASTTDSNASNTASASITMLPAGPFAPLSITKSVNPTSAIEGSTTTVDYAITVTNNSTSTTSTDVVVNDLLPSGLTFVSSTPSSSYNATSGVWTVGNLAAGASSTLAIAAEVDSDATTTITNLATVFASTTDSNASNTASASITMLPAGPFAPLSITKSVNPTSAIEGSTTTVDYAITVTNNSTSTTSTDVVVNDLLPSGLTFVSSTPSSSYNATSGVWTVGNLAAGASSTLAIAAEVDSDATTTITNLATVFASTTDSNASNTASASITMLPAGPFAPLSITKSVNPTSAIEGSTTTVDYAITVTNNSTSTTSTDVVVNDLLPSGLTFVSSTPSSSYNATSGVWTVGNLAAGASSTLAIAAEVDSDATTTITNLATVFASTTDSNASNTASASITMLPAGPFAPLSITKSVNPTSAIEGSTTTVDYAITVTNNSTSTTSTDVVVNDLLPSGLTFVSSTPSSSYNATSGVWTVGNLAAGASSTLAIAAEVDSDATTTITNLATVFASTTDSNASNTASASITMLPAGPFAPLSITKSVNPTSAIEGSTTTVDYAITVTNNSTSTTSTDVVVNDLLPSGLTFVSSTPSSSYNATSGVWTVGNLAAGASSTLAIAAEVDSDATTTITNLATVFASTTDSNASNTASASITIGSVIPPNGCSTNCGGGGGSAQSNLAIVKTVDNANPVTGGVIHYTLTVTDGGPSNSFGAVASDTLPSGLTFDSASSSEGSYNSSTGIWTIGVISNGQKATLTITATVTAAAGTTITNVGTVSEAQGIINATPGDDSSSATITVAGGSNGGGGGGGQVLGTSTSTGQVLGASCGLYLTSYIHPDRQNLNDPAQVTKLQTFLNMNLGLNLPVTGYYGSETIAAVDQFQVKYHLEVLKPWLSLGLPTQFTPTSYVYQTTQRWINLIMCPSLNIPAPQLVVDQGGE